MSIQAVPRSSGGTIRRSLDTSSAGTQRQNELRDMADDEGYAEPNLWTGIGRARSGAGAAIVGGPDQVLAKIRAYADLGMHAFILSGYPHAAEADLFARHVLPHLDHAPLLPRLTRTAHKLYLKRRSVAPPAVGGPSLA
jgi:alkanesulfonate monooxygenase